MIRAKESVGVPEIDFQVKDPTPGREIRKTKNYIWGTVWGKET